MPGNGGAEGRRGIPTVVAKFALLDDARDAIEHLEHAGIDGDAISLLGAAPEEARHEGGQRRPDRRMLRHMIARVGRGIAIGCVVGAPVGISIAALLVVVFSAKSTGSLFAACALGGVLFGGLTGAMTSMERAAGFSEAWPLTFYEVSGGPVWVAVFDGSRQASDALAASDPIELRHPVDTKSLARLVRRGE